MKTKQNNPTRIYRMVSTGDRLPHTEDDYDDIELTVIFEDGSMSTDTHPNSAGVVGWLEEIELPSEEDLYDHVNTIDERDYSMNEEWLDGANFILNHIKGGGEREL